jgi:hypothetical protein
VTDNTAYSKEVLPVVEPILVWNNCYEEGWKLFLIYGKN